MTRPLIPDERDHWRSLPLITLHVMLQRERQRGEEGHWAYDLGRHEAMLKVYCERKQAQCQS